MSLIQHLNLLFQGPTSIYVTVIANENLPVWVVNEWEVDDFYRKNMGRRLLGVMHFVSQHFTGKSSTFSPS